MFLTPKNKGAKFPNMDVFVSGCFDLIHAGHVEFLEQAGRFGKLHVAVGSDDTVYSLKGRLPVYTEKERVFILSALACVDRAFVSSGSGMIDFERELRELRPGLFLVNEDGHSMEKASLCAELGINYRVLRRRPHAGLPRRSTSELLSENRIPYRIDLAGGWLDQPWVSKHGSGSVVTVSIEPTTDFDERSGLATSTRRVAIELWKTAIPAGDYETMARLLFAVENPPGKYPVSGSQDSIGIVFPGFAKCEYRGAYWPDQIVHLRDQKIAQFVTEHIRLVPLGPRKGECDVLAHTEVTPAGVQDLALAADRCWEALLSYDLVEFGRAVRASFYAQISMFPCMVNEAIRQLMKRYEEVSYGYKLCGAGGGGYAMLVSDGDVKEGVPIIVRG